MAGLAVVALAVMTFIFYLIAVVFDYPWQQASAIATGEPIAWIVVLALVLVRPTPHRPARDPRLQLVADLAGFLAITAIPVRQDHRGPTGLDGRLAGDHPTHWSDVAYSMSNDDRLRIASRNWSERKRQNKWEKRAREELQARSEESDGASMRLRIPRDRYPESEQAGDDASFESTPMQEGVSIDPSFSVGPSIVDADDPASVEYQRLLEEIRSAFEDWQWELAREESSDESGDTPYDPLPEVMRISSDVWSWHSDDNMRRVFAEGIDLSAERIERNLPKVIARRQTTVQSGMRHMSAKIAATLRSYALELMLGGVQRDQALSDKFTSALVAASSGRWEDLATVEPQATVDRFIKRYGVRLAVAVFLLAAAVFVPIWLQAWIGEATTQFRIVLVTAAVLGLTETPKTAVERVGNYLTSVRNQQ